MGWLQWIVLLLTKNPPDNASKHFFFQAVVVTKYLFQFGFFPWNKGIIEESPFYPPRILGIEQKDNYANVDIALLLALFIHRSILKVRCSAVVAYQ